MIDGDLKRIVVKVGTNTLCDPDGRPDPQLLRSVAHQVHLLRSQGKQVLIVSSGAIGSGQAALGLRDTPQDIAARQACAAVGQHRLMSAWQEAFQKDKVIVAQVLVTYHTFDKRRSYVNLRACIEKLLALGVVPIINENDTVSIREIDATFGDNDRLGALVASKVEADLTIILSDVDGLYDKPPHVKGAKIVHHVERVTDDILEMADDKPGRGGRGGMRSKLLSCRLLTEQGVAVVIAYGRADEILTRLLDEESEEQIGTWFDVVGHRRGHERWIQAAHPEGRILVDAGAAKALGDGFHLLPAGVTGVEGQFGVESVVEIVHDDKVIGRAVSHLSSGDLARCKGMQSEEAKQILEFDGPVNVTRKGRLVLQD